MQSDPLVNGKSMKGGAVCLDWTRRGENIQSPQEMGGLSRKNASCDNMHYQGSIIMILWGIQSVSRDLSQQSS